MAVGLLLYVRGGFVGALTLILCVEAGALALGLWSAPPDEEPPWTGIRRSWFVLLVSLVVAAALGAGWEALGGLSGSWLARGLGLACLAALPLYAAGAVLGAPALAAGDPPVPVGPAAAAGAAAGFALVGFGRSGLLIAPLAYVGGVVLVSAGALLHTRVLEERERRWRDLAELASARREEPAGGDGALPAEPPSLGAAPPGG